MTNFLEETKQEINDVGKTVDDIVYIGSYESNLGVKDFKEFEKLADFEYHSGYGSSEIPVNLVIVFKDGSWLERGEYDGSEWWEFKKTPKVWDKIVPFKRIKVVDYKFTLEEVNTDE